MLSKNHKYRLTQTGKINQSPDIFALVALDLLLLCVFFYTSYRKKGKTFFFFCLIVFKLIMSVFYNCAIYNQIKTLNLLFDHKIFYQLN